MNNEIFEKREFKEIRFNKTVKDTLNCWALKHSSLMITKRNAYITITIKNDNRVAEFYIDKEQFAEVVKGMQDIAR